MSLPARHAVLIAGAAVDPAGKEVVESLLADLQGLRPNLGTTVVSADPVGMARHDGVRAIAWTDRAAILDAVQASDLVILAGGELAETDPAVRTEVLPTERQLGVSLYPLLAVLAALAGRPCAICGVGVGPLESAAARVLARATFELADVATVRDSASRDLLRGLGLPPDAIRLASSRESAELAIALLDRPPVRGSKAALAPFFAGWGREQNRGLAANRELADGPTAALDGRDREVAALTAESLFLQDRLASLEGSSSWRLTAPMRALSDALRRLPSVPRQATAIVRSEGVPVLLRRSRRKLASGVRAAFPRWPSRVRADAELARILAEHPGQPLMVARPFLDWRIPLFQRPQQLARSLGAQGFLYFYCTTNIHDRVRAFQRMGPGCYLTDQFPLLDELSPQVVHVYSTDHNCLLSWVMHHLARGHTVVYEYIDELHPDVGGRPITDAVWQKHRFLLKHEAQVICIASADNLYRDISRVRSRNVALVTNGAELERFAVRREPASVPPEIADLVATGRPIVGYFGALAKWFDYELVLELARARPEYQILLIGWSYDGSMKRYRWKGLRNVRVLGPIEYAVLPRYACWFDVATIPFRVNEITQSTSPIKLFEYMALGKPIVTTALHECRKYRSVLIAESRGEFVEQVDRAVGLRHDAAYLEVVREEAEANTWDQKAGDIARLIRQASQPAPATGRRS